ncbi:MAG TPA: [Fe-Fe] hydrogenase large subunit C-terminal domain-containing protein [Bacteroidales bacterium]|nr:[Fe-Fe] hydrogenase large subunit C-terminal domain-containing protein [Bacteroidales bacterium]HRZ48230.1 [Fe-Fe] hydrogenase large subunit C-terminal domain-containing protein [Bacteroidales bacterium]
MTSTVPTGMNLPLLSIDSRKCTLCYTCIRICPVKAIQVKHNQPFAEIDDQRCIGCGNCLDICPEEAISFRSSVQQVYQLLDSEHKVAAIVDPSISGEFDDITDYRKFVKMIRELGFDYVTEVSFGVDIIAANYRHLVGDFRGKYYMFSNCPAVVMHIEKYNPELIGNLAPITTAMTVSACVVREKYGQELKVVAISPCIAAKREALRYEDSGKVDELITFRELREMFAEKQIEESKLEFSDFDQPLGAAGALYPVSEGIIQAARLSEDLLDGSIITSEGSGNIATAIGEFSTHIDDLQKHFNLFYCEGCLMGPGTSPNRNKFLRRSLVINYARKRDSIFDKQAWQDQFTEYARLNTEAVFRNDDQRMEEPSEEKISEIMRIIGKGDEVGMKGCSACGYPSCREFAVAVAKGLAKTEMCHSHNLRNQQEYIRSLRITNEKLAQTRQALEDSEKEARKEKETALEAMEITRSMLQKIPSGILLVNENLKIIQANQTFVRLLGDEVAEINEIIPGLEGADLKTLVPYNFYSYFTYVLDHDESVVNKDVHYGERIYNLSVFSIRKHRIVGAVIRDLQSPEVRGEEVVNRLSEAIDENLRMVQQIGFLLGEGAANTEKVLNSLIESFKAAEKGSK